MCGSNCPLKGVGKNAVVVAKAHPPDETYPEYLRERAISALLELERMAYKNFEEAIALAAAAGVFHAVTAMANQGCSAVARVELIHQALVLLRP